MNDNEIIEELICQVYVQEPWTPDTRVNPPLTMRQVEAAEEMLGFNMPPLLKRLYTEVGNGGFGIGAPKSHGYIMPLLLDPDRPDLLDLSEFSAVGYYLEHWIDAITTNGTPKWDPSDPEFYWMEGLLPFCYHGCTVFSLVHCTRPNAPVINWDNSRPQSLVEWWFETDERRYEDYRDLQGGAYVDCFSFKDWLVAHMNNIPTSVIRAMDKKQKKKKRY